MPQRLLAIALTLILLGCAAPNASPAAPTATPTITLTPTPTVTPTPSATPTPIGYVQHYRAEVIARYPHDPTAYTQGLLWVDGLIYEGTGYYQTSLREIDLTTGEVLRSQQPSPEHFGEGLALVGDEFIQLTWTEQLAYRYDRTTLEVLGTYSYIGEGWGLCFDGTHLYMSDGTSTITVRDPATFEAVSTIPVTHLGVSITQLNELECVGDSVYANVWFTEQIMQINKHTGEVIGVVDASGLLAEAERSADINDVLNGIAYIPERDTFLLTGKRWPALFEVTFIPTE